MALEDRQQAFCQEYIIDFNATQAAIRAGYELQTYPKRHYVYFLIDPASEKIFYVGKGKGSRVKQHVINAKRRNQDNPVKQLKILEIIGSGKEVKEVIFANDLLEDDALSLERKLIAKLKHTGLTNISGGVITSKEASGKRAEMILSRLKSFDDWIETISESQLNAVITVAGSPYTFYRKLIDDLTELKEMRHLSQSALMCHG